jgi:putative flippase GtrA
MNQSTKELLKFIVSGIIAVGTDLFFYYLLIETMNPNNSKGISFIMGTVVAFILNKFWTFEKVEKSFKEIMQFVILYGSTLFINVLINKIVLDFTSTILISFIIATGVSSILNFIGQKFWIFR